MKNNFFLILADKRRETVQKAVKINDKTLRISKKNMSGLSADIVTYVMLLALSVIFIVPFLYILSKSLMSAEDLVDTNVQWIPRKLIFENYTFAFMVLSYIPRLIRSVSVAGVSVLGQVLSCSFVAYGIARMKFKGRGIIFSLVIFAMLIPPQAIIVTQYLEFAKLRMLDTFWPIILPCFFSLGLNGGLFVFLFHQFFKAMPKELEDAALIDGTGIFGAFFRVVFPNSGATILVTSILSFIWQWNNYFEPGIYITIRDKYTLSMMLPALGSESVSMNMSSGFNNGTWLAATCLCVLPVIIIFFILQKRFIKGIETTGLAN